MRIKQLKSIIVKKKLKVPRKNSFGTQKFRSGFFVKLTEQNGVEGYGEGFCNWPNFSADYRDKYINDLFRIGEKSTSHFLSCSSSPSSFLPT